MAFALAVAVVTIVSFHSFLYDFSLMILALLIAGSVVTSSDLVPHKKAYLIVTLGFLFFLTPLYLMLLWIARFGLFFLLASAGILLMGRWGTGGLRAIVPASGEKSNSISLPAT